MPRERTICLFGKGQLISFFLFCCPQYVIAEWHNCFGYYRKYISPTGELFDWLELDSSFYDLWNDQFVFENEIFSRI